jgi:BirA family biotin operon repressor/biotin-[acetyl-CoA-carboxylase] ligase
MIGDDEDRQIEMLRMLGGTEFVSGQVIASKLGISRAAVWKRIGKLRESGVRIERQRGRGYRLASPIEPLDGSAILDGLAPDMKARILRIEIFPSVASTSGLLLERLRSGSEVHGIFVFAEQQTRGRGRRGRQWISPFGRNIYFSFGWMFDHGVARLGGLSLVIGIAVVRALRRFGLADVRLKWPNDLVVGGAKLAGILVDIDGDSSGPVSAVIGIGVNCSMPSEFGKEIDQNWTDIEAHCTVAISRNALAAQLLSSCVEALDEFCTRGFSPFLPEWNRMDALKGRSVEVAYASGPLRGLARGVDETGALLLETGDHVVSLSGGEVTVRSRS